MTQDCDACGITHASAKERDAMHGAVRRVRQWFRQQVTMAMAKPATPAKVKRADAPKAKAVGR